MERTDRGKRILWWGRYDHDYSRNRILLKALRAGGFICENYRPKLSAYPLVDSILCRPSNVPDAVWVPAFRHRDFLGARLFADKHKIPLIFDPLISSWDKAVFERKKIKEKSRAAKRLLKWERSLFSRADLVIADTELHADFYVDVLEADVGRVAVVPVGAEEDIFIPQPQTKISEPPEVLFYGSFIHLQGPEVIAEAVRRLPEVQWAMVGEGPLRKKCEDICSDCRNVTFEDWIPYEQLPERIGKATLLLGIFGTTAKPGRVIPNKVYQALASGRPVITRHSEAYPAKLIESREKGICFIEPGNPDDLAMTIKKMLENPDGCREIGKVARENYDHYFSAKKVESSLNAALSIIGL